MAERGEVRMGMTGDREPEGSAERQRLEAEFLLAVRRNGSIIQLLGQVSRSEERRVGKEC